MKTIELEIEKIEIKIAGKAYQMDMPYGDSFDELHEKLKEEDKKELEERRDLKILREFFAKLGLEEEALKKLQVQHYKKIIEGIAPKKD